MNAARLSAGNQLSMRRAKLGKAQHQIAKEIGCSPSAVSAWETDERRPGLEYFRRIAETYRVDVALLIAWFE